MTFENKIQKFPSIYKNSKTENRQVFGFWENRKIALPKGINEFGNLPFIWNNLNLLDVEVSLINNLFSPPSLVSKSTLSPLSLTTYLSDG